MKKSTSNLICFSCSIFRAVLETLRSRGEVDFPVHYLDSTLHLYPDELRQSLETRLKSALAGGSQVLLLYGDCHAYMNEQEKYPGVCRVRGINCPEILLGRDTYRALRKEGAFFLLPEWTMRWQEIFHVELGLEGQVAKDFMQEMHTKLLYLDTGQIPVPTTHLEAISTYFGLPWEIRPVGTGHLADAIRAALHEMTARNEGDES